MTEQPDPYALAAEAASSLTQRLGVEKLDAAIVLGSGWSTAAAGLGEWLRKAQNGNVRSYGLILGAGVIVLAVVALLGQLG